MEYSKTSALRTFHTGCPRWNSDQRWSSSTRRIPYPRSLSRPRTLVKVWWISLCECFHWLAGEALSHSHAVEWIRGSRIQSHWPCMTLWPISMFSRIFATDRPAVPSTQAGFHR